MGSGKGKTRRVQASAATGTELPVFARAYKYTVTIPPHTTLDDVEDVVEAMRQFGGAELNVEDRQITGDFELEATEAFAAGYEFKEREEEIRTELASRGWNETVAPKAVVTHEAVQAAQQKALQVLTVDHPEVNGIGITKVDGELALKVNLVSEPKKGLPLQVDGVRVISEVVGVVRASAST